MNPPKKYKDYESALVRLEEITSQLESGGSSLENAIALYTEGVEIAKFCAGKLDEAEKKIKILMEKNGELVEADFEEEADEG